MRGLPVLIVLLAPLGGCLSPETSGFFRERVEVTRDDLDPAVGTASIETASSGEPISIALEVEGYGPGQAPILDALVKGLERDPGLSVASIAYRGELAGRANALRALLETPSRPPERRVVLALATDFSASAANGFIASPGMIAFLPMSLGYGWEAMLDVSWRVRGEDGVESPGRRRVSVEFRELNARRSAIFHVWPSTGFLGVQFVAGLVLAPTFWFYDDEDTTPLLLKALEPRLGASIAGSVRRDVAASRDSRALNGSAPAPPRGTARAPRPSGPG